MEEKKEKIKKINKQIIVALIPCLLNGLLTYGICNLHLFSAYMPAIFFSNFLMYAIFIFITIFVKKTHITTYIIAIFIFVISIINNVKLYYTQSPVYLSDLYFLNNLGEITGIVKNDLFSHIDYAQLAILFVMLLILCTLSKICSMEIRDRKIRLVSLTVILVIFTILLLPISTKDKLILATIYDVNERKDYGAAITGLDYYTKYGVIAGIYGMELEERRNPPASYNKDEIKNILETADKQREEEKEVINQNDMEQNNPNIIIMFQESYWDIENIEEVEFDKNITENMNKLKEQGSSVKLLSPSYGGLSSNIEFELLTGGNLCYFGTGYHPFVQLYRQKQAENNPSIIKDLKDNGYRTKMEFGVDYYSSQNVYKKLGIDQYVNTMSDRSDYEEKVKGTHISDEALVDDVINELHNKTKEEKIFYMTATIQSHTPFYKEKYDNYDIHVVSSSLSEEETGVVLSYAQGVYDTNQQIQRLYDEIQKIDEPTILIVLGDHLPYLYNKDSEDILLQKSSYFNTGDEKQDMLRKYTTEGIVLSNYNKKIEFESEYISPDMLLTSVVNQIDIKISPYYQWLYQIRDILPAQNQYFNISKNSEIYYQNEVLSEEMQKAKETREKIQYYLFEDKQK